MSALDDARRGYQVVLDLIAQQQRIDDKAVAMAGLAVQLAIAEELRTANLIAHANAGNMLPGPEVRKRLGIA